MTAFYAVVRMVTAGVLIAIASSVAAQQDYPSKPIRFITPFAPGGSTTIVARLFGQKLTESWGQPVIVDNRPGGNTIIGTEALTKAPPDGYTILLVLNSHVINSLLTANLPYDTFKDFAPVATIASSEYVLVINPSVPAKNLQEFIALAKSKPGQLNYASAGSGGIAHLGTELFNIMAGIKMQHIPYKGSGPALTDVIGGQVQMYLCSPAGAIPHVKSGRLKAIAVSGETRLSALPQVPTFTEAGLPGFDTKSWQGVLAPAGTPQHIINKLSSEMAKIAVMPDIRNKLVSLGMGPFYSTAEQFAALMQADKAKFAKLIKAANIKLER
ncbi:MAG: tripartite tricarboxylate transporter substrate binding protein [Pseudomonadota bacterium]